MSNFEPSFWTALTALINAQWPEANGQIYRVAQINRTNWLNLLDGGTLTPPYVVCDVLNRRAAPDWGMNAKAYFYPVEIYYVSLTSGTTNIVADIGAKLSLLRDALLASTSPYLQVPEEPVLDLSDENPANTVFYSLPTAPGLFGGMISADLLTGELY